MSDYHETKNLIMLKAKENSSGIGISKKTLYNHFDGKEQFKIMNKNELSEAATVNSIEVRNFTKNFGGVTAVDDISFSVEQGTIFAFLGPNGAGKSTTINTLCTIQEKTSGELRINGNDVTSQKRQG